MMDKLNVEFHVSVLTVPSFVSADKFPEWLHHEALAIQDLSDDNSLTELKKQVEAMRTQIDKLASKS